MKRLKNLLQHKYLFKIILLMSIIYLIIITRVITYKSKYDINTTSFEVIITNIKIDDNKLTLNVKGKENIIANLYFKEEKNNYTNLLIGDTIIIKGTLKEPKNNTIPNLFNYKKYLYNKKIYYLIDIEKITKIKNNTNLIYDIKNKINKRINSISKSSPYIKTFILGNKYYLDEEVDTSYKDLGLSHLFSISGMHISLLSSILLLFLKKISYNRFYNYSIVISFLLIYMLILNTPASVFRSVIMYIVFALNSLFNLKIRKIDLLLFILSICLFINPFIIYDMGFQFSYLISFNLIMLNKKINKYHNYLVKTLYLSLISFLVSFPIVIYYFYQVNLISIIVNTIIIPYISFVIFPLSIITFIIPSLDNFLFFFINILENITILINKIEITKIIFAKPSIIFIIFYYLILFLSLYKVKYYKYLIIIIICYKMSVYLDNSLNIIMLDVNQGDSLVITTEYKKEIILIDTGGYPNLDSSIVLKRTIPYLKSIGINKIDYLIITHGDADHMKDSIDLVNNFKVGKVIFNKGIYNELEEELIKILVKKKIGYEKCKDYLRLSNNILYFLNNNIYDNENDNSNVIYMDSNNKKILLMGDSSSVVEEDLIKKYQLYDIDFLKVGHHGSNTSSSKMFIDELKPDNCLISVGNNNIYGHPKKEVLNRLNKCNVYRTDNMGSIAIKIDKNKYQIKTYSP